MRNMPKSYIKSGKYTICALAILCAAAAAVCISGNGISDASALSVRLLYGYSGQDPAAASESTDEIQKERVYTYTEYTFDDSNILSSGSRLVPSSDNEDIVSGSPESAPENFSENGEYLRGGVIIYEQYGKYSGENYIDLKGGGQVRNITRVSNSELTALSDKPPVFELSEDGGPDVLIMHTHTTECYEPYEREYYDLNRSCRVLDEAENMVSVGNEIAAALYENGIGVIHDTTVHDYPDYNGAYDRSRATVMNILEKYPSIKIVLDIHRDAIERGDARIAPVTEINGRKAAQVMIICGCDDGTMDMPLFTENFRFACALQSCIETDFPTLTRPVLFDYRHYNQDLTTGSLLIEVGSHANTLDQAKYSGKLIGQALAELMRNAELI